jgi:hypothetical protein
VLINKQIFTEALMPDIIEMVRNNIIRQTAPQTDDFDPEVCCLCAVGQGLTPYNTA